MTSTDVEFGLTAVAAMLSPTTLSFSVLALVLGDRPLRTGFWFFLGAFAVMLVIGVAAAFVLGDSATASSGSSTPPTWVAIFDLIAGALLLVYVGRNARKMRQPADSKRTADMIEKMSKVASSPAVAIVAAGATLANAGGFIPIGLKDISQLKPSAAEYVTYWVGFTLVSLLPLLAALVSLLVARDWTTAKLQSMRRWLERNAMTIAMAIIALLAATLIRNGIVALTS